MVIASTGRLSPAGRVYNTEKKGAIEARDEGASGGLLVFLKPARGGDKKPRGSNVSSTIFQVNKDYEWMDGRLMHHHLSITPHTRRHAPPPLAGNGLSEVVSTSLHFSEE